MCLDLLEQMKSCSVFSTSCLCVSFLTSFLCSDCGFAVTVGLAARQLFLPQLSEQRPALRSSSTAVPRSVSSIGLLLHHRPLHPHSHTQTLQFILGVISSGVCRSGAGFTAERCSSSSRSPLIFALQSLALSPPAGLKQLEKQPSIVFSILKMFPP